MGFVAWWTIYVRGESPNTNTNVPHIGLDRTNARRSGYQTNVSQPNARILKRWGNIIFK
jgi:hypothetical protein